MKYRDHRGGFDESMKTVKNFNSANELIEHLTQTHGRKIEKIKFKYVGFDEINMWNTSYVLMKFSEQKEFNIAGMSDGQLKIN